MKTIDVSKSVMNQVVGFEKRRSAWWIGKFLFILFVLGALGIWVFWVAVTEIFERQTLDLFALFTQDKEVIGQFWQDTVMVFWEELPQEKLVIGFLALLGVVIFIFINRKNIFIIWKKMRQLAKYNKSGNNR